MKNAVDFATLNELYDRAVCSGDEPDGIDYGIMPLGTFRFLAAQQNPEDIKAHVREFLEATQDLNATYGVVIHGDRISLAEWTE